MEIDYSMFNLPELLSVNKSDYWQQRMTLRAKILIEFLQKNDLLKDIEPYNGKGEVRDDLVIRMSNLTPDGIALFEKSVGNWYRAHDRGTPIEKTTILEKGLKKIRSQK